MTEHPVRRLLSRLRANQALQSSASPGDAGISNEAGEKRNSLIGELTNRIAVLAEEDSSPDSGGERRTSRLPESRSPHPPASRTPEKSIKTSAGSETSPRKPKLTTKTSVNQRPYFALDSKPIKKEIVSNRGIPASTPSSRPERTSHSEASVMEDTSAMHVVNPTGQDEPVDPSMRRKQRFKGQYEQEGIEAGKGWQTNRSEAKANASTSRGHTEDLYIAVDKGPKLTAHKPRPCSEASKVEEAIKLTENQVSRISVIPTLAGRGH
ncbi:unnamed protein product [Protopolystoma xenopodis]|uniref:Uncharacterized protein n=1 Tax=Protopolystoma xenopodis TaxID=117903 RepID=A0A448WJH0_9PLAT|nr:unnamed protein product [Protopolystoma xenopodis]